MYSEEKKRLTRKMEATTELTRLASCIQVRPNLNEMIVVVGVNVTESHDEIHGY